VTQFATPLVAAFAIALAVAAIIEVPGLRTGLNFADEGYLWYGTQQVLNGRVPIRDFRAYDPGRYYWCALFCLIFGRRNLSLRLAMLALRVVTLALAAWLIHRATGDLLATAFWTLALGACSPPWYKQTEVFFSVAAVATATLFIEAPTFAMHAVTGGFAGLSLLFGLNLALYNAAGLVGTWLFAIARSGYEGSTPLLWFTAGVLAGLSPSVVMFATVPALWRAYWRHKVLPVLGRGSANLRVPIPWLWRPTPPQVAGPLYHKRVVKIGFTALPLFYLAMLGWLLLRPPPDSPWVGVATASACIGACYMHYAMSRADPEHLWLAFAPFVIGIASVSPRGGLGALLAVCAGITAFGSVHASVNEAVLRRRHPDWFTRYQVGSDEFWLLKDSVDRLESIREAVEAHTREGDPVLFVPLLVTLYPLWSRRIPIYDMFCVHAAAPGAEDAMIDSLEREHVRLAVVWNAALDGLEERRFSRTHPQVWRYLECEFEPIRLISPHVDFHCFVRP